MDRYAPSQWHRDFPIAAGRWSRALQFAARVPRGLANATVRVPPRGHPLTGTGSGMSPRADIRRSETFSPSPRASELTLGDLLAVSSRIGGAVGVVTLRERKACSLISSDQ